MTKAACSKTLDTSEWTDTVLAKGDLREFKASHPMLHLHRIVLSKVDSGISEMEIRAIRKVIQDKLIKHFGFAAIGNISVI